jgi:hypothetical protein
MEEDNNGDNDKDYGDEDSYKSDAFSTGAPEQNGEDDDEDDNFWDELRGPRMSNPKDHKRLNVSGVSTDQQWQAWDTLWSLSPAFQDVFREPDNVSLFDLRSNAAFCKKVLKRAPPELAPLAKTRFPCPSPALERHTRKNKAATDKAKRNAAFFLPAQATT